MPAFDLAATLRARYPDATPGVDYVLNKPADAPLTLRLWAPSLGPIPQDLLDAQAADADKQAARAAREAAFHDALPLDLVLDALIDAVEAPPGSKLEAIKATRDDLNKRHPDPDAE